eukprot:comp15790_c0_seq1/m.13043 comp15790_c0_seq1/g.13043  ORF comp15790_c0_seq1/g.13043 comp15790_c0_seq1/m.13043 type:complete len:532 (-) comp15790_c0_seq1:224-1819(-)
MGLVLSLLSGLWQLARAIWCDIVLHVRHSEDPEASDCRQRLARADTFPNWYAAAVEYDRLLGNEQWKQTDSSKHYDHQLIRKRLESLRTARMAEDTASVIFLLRAGLVRGLGGINNPRLLTKCYWGTKRLAEEYVEEVCLNLQHLCDCPTRDFSPITKVRFFTDMRQAYGRSALLLSGGASLGLYHFGVVKCLYEHQLLPRVISGASIGALLTALLGVHTDEELKRLFLPNAISFEAFDRLGKGSARRKITRFLKHGVLMDINKLEEFCISNIGNYTFLEAYHRTHRVINIAVASRRSYEVPWLLNYLTAPNVLIWSAALASCSLPGVYAPVDLMAKDHDGNTVRWNPSRHLWSEATLENDLPMTRLSELFNVNHFIVSQVNPHVIPFLSLFQRDAHTPSRLGQLLAKTKGPILAELHHLAMQASILVPAAFSIFQHVLAQKYVGDVTIVPDVPLSSLLAFFSNPSEELCQEAIRVGERSTWPYISQLRASLKIEMCLDLCLKAVREDGNDDRPVEPIRSPIFPAKSRRSM